MSKLERLCEIEGYTDPMDLLEAHSIDSMCPAICINCEHTEELELDCIGGFCNVCKKHTMTSAMVLAGVI